MALMKGSVEIRIFVCRGFSDQLIEKLSFQNTFSRHKNATQLFPSELYDKSASSTFEINPVFPKI